MNKFKFISKKKFENLPKVPGVYAFKKGVKLLYIGKAANLKERTKQHKELLSLTTKLGYVKTNSEIEALILEANLIKKYKPKYNIIWRDDKNYFFVAKTVEDFPRIFWTHQRKLKTKNLKLKAEFIGPFVDGTALKATLKILRKIFPYRSCNKIPNHPCLWYQLDRCPAPCLLKSKTAQQIPMLESKIKQEDQRNTKNLIKILQGKKTKVLKDFKKEMKKFSGVQGFEKAAKIRDQIQVFEKVISHSKIFPEAVGIKYRQKEYRQKEKWKTIQKTLQKILKLKYRISRIEAYDVSNIQGQEATGSMVTFINGKPEKSQYRKFKIRIAGKPNDVVMLKEILHRRINHPEWGWPDLILIDGGKAQLNAALKIKDLRLQPTHHILPPLVGPLKIKEIKFVSLAKKKNELFIEGRKQPILLKKLPREIFNLILQLRDEAHRFAISYHRKLREIDLRESL